MFGECPRVHIEHTIAEIKQFWMVQLVNIIECDLDLDAVQYLVASVNIKIFF